VWDKPFRYSIFTAVYELLFWREEGVNDFNIDWDFIFENAKFEVKPDIEDLNQVMYLFEQKEKSYTDILESYLANWDKTFSIIKACLFTFLLEKDDIGNSEPPVDSKDIVTKYIRLSEDLVGGQNVGLVHAVLSKIAGVQKEISEIKN
jgi:transcription termination factor NusB